MQGEMRKQKLVVSQFEYDRMLASSDWTPEQIAELFIPAPPRPDVRDDLVQPDEKIADPYRPNRAARRAMAKANRRR